MADQYTPEEIAEIFEAYNNAVKSGTPITADLAKQMKDAAAGVKGYAQAQENLFKSLGKSVADYTKEMYKGEQGTKAFNNSIDTITTALEGLIMLLPFIKGMSVVTKLATVGLYGFLKSVKLAGEQSDKLYKSYQDLSRAGAATAGGMTEIFNSMQKLGYGLEELDKMTALIRENAEALSNFGGTVGEGTRAFTNAAGEIQRSDVGRSLQMLGKTPEDINRGIAMFVKQQQQSGVSATNINKNLAQQSAEYIRNLDRLSKLTGKDADSLQAKLDEAMEEDAFNQKIYELKQRAAQGDVEAGRLAAEYENAARRLEGDARKEFVRGVGGDLSSMTKSLMTSSEAVGMIGTTAFTASGYIDKMAKGADRFRGTLGGLYGLNALDDVGFKARELSKVQSRYADSTAQQQEDLARAQQELQQKGLDPATKAATELRISQMQARDSLQSFVNQGVKPATEALAALAKGGAGAAKVATGGVGPAPMGGTGRMDYGKELYGTGAAAPMGGTGRMDYGKELYGTGAATPTAAPTAAPSGAPATGKGLTGKPLSGVSPGLAQALQSAAAEYNQLTGKTVEVTSAVRDSAKQAQLYQDYISGKSSFPAAPPGRSKHEQGLAVDVGRAVADELDRMGLLRKYGLSRPVANDPVHIEASAEFGGVLSGPKSGFQAMLHGTEAVVPLPNGKSIPVEMPRLDESFSNQATILTQQLNKLTELVNAVQNRTSSGDQSGLMNQQLIKLDELVRVMQNQVSVSTKILQAAN